MAKGLWDSLLEPRKDLKQRLLFLFERQAPGTSSWADSLHLLVCDVPLAEEGSLQSLLYQSSREKHLSIL